MALIYEATLSPTKLELLSTWLTTRPWAGEPGKVRRLGAYRFDDPAGEVGIETFLLGAASGQVLHVPLTYRALPVEGAEEHLVGTTEHSVLGTRWVYDGCADPVWATQLLTAVLAGGTQVEMYMDGKLLPDTATVQGSGTPGTPVDEVATVTPHDEGETTVVRAGDHEIVVTRVVGAEVDASQTLTGRWGDSGHAVLAGVRDA